MLNEGFTPLYSSTFKINVEKPDANYFSNFQGITMILPRGISAYFKWENILGKDYYTITNIMFGGRMELSI